MNKKLIWWEKSVEYKFVREYLKDDDAIAALDGSHEKAGDAIFESGSNWSLIEFKRNMESIADEHGKYGNYAYEAAKNTLGSRDSAHIIIFGLAETGSLALRAQTYFSEKNIPDIKSALLRGFDKTTFIEYLEELMAFKNSATQTSSDSNFGSVAVSCRYNGKLQTLSFEEAGLSLGIIKSIKRKIERDIEF